MAPLPNYYEILQVSPNAEQEVILSAYKRLSLKYHPDNNHSPGAKERMVQFNAAFEVIGNPQKRKEYDQQFKGQPYPAQPPNETRPSPPSPSSDASGAAICVVCPQCKKDDRIRKVAAILEAQDTPVLAQSLQPPPPPTYPVQPHPAERRGRGDLEDYQKRVQDYAGEMERWQRAMELWNQLYYCDRNVCVFVPGVDKSASLSEMAQYLYSLEDNLWTNEGK